MTLNQVWEGRFDSLDEAVLHASSPSHDKLFANASWLSRQRQLMINETAASGSLNELLGGRLTTLPLLLAGISGEVSILDLGGGSGWC